MSLPQTILALMPQIKEQTKALYDGHSCLCEDAASSGMCNHLLVKQGLRKRYRVRKGGRS